MFGLLIRNAPRPRAWRLAPVALCAFLLSPMLIHAWRNANTSIWDGLFLYNLATSVLWLLLGHALFVRPVFLHLALLPLYLSTAIDLFLVWTFHARLSSGYILIALTDFEEAGEFLAAYAAPIAWIGAVCLAVCIPALYGAWGLRGARKGRVAGVAAGLLLAIYGAVIVRAVWPGEVVAARVIQDLAGKEMGAPFGVLAQAGLALQLQSDNAKARQLRRTSHFNAKQSVPSHGEIHVLVIGESSRPHNWSLFGYSRLTTPLLAAQSGLVTLPDVWTQAPHTSVAVPAMLSLSAITDWHAIAANRSVVDAFGEAGFKTWWLSAQEADTWGGLVSQVASEAKRRRYFDRSFDGAMLDEFRAIVKSAVPQDNLFIVLHTKGSHFEYSHRYPAAFDRFVSPAATRRERLVNTYDNSILYTDWFLNEVISELGKSGTKSVLFYASDHGENLLDDERQLFGHALGTQFDLPTAAFVWFSDAMRRDKPAAFNALQRNRAAALSLENLPHSMLDLAGIQANGLAASSSIFNPQFAIQPRWFMVRGELKRDPLRPALRP